MRKYLIPYLTILSVLLPASISASGGLSIIYEGINSAQAGLLFQRGSFSSKVVFGASYEYIKKDNNTFLFSRSSFAINAYSGYQKCVANDLWLSFMPGITGELNYKKEMGSATNDYYSGGLLYNIGIIKNSGNWTLGINNDLVIYSLGLEKRTEQSSVVKTTYKDIRLNFLPKILIGFRF